MSSVTYMLDLEMGHILSCRGVVEAGPSDVVIACPGCRGSKGKAQTWRSSVVITRPQLYLDKPLITWPTLLTGILSRL